MEIRWVSPFIYVSFNAHLFFIKKSTFAYIKEQGLPKA